MKSAVDRTGRQAHVNAKPKRQRQRPPVPFEEGYLRRRSLALLALSKCGYCDDDLIAMFHIGRRTLQRYLAVARSVAKAMGLEDASWQRLGKSGSAVITRD